MDFYQHADLTLLRSLGTSQMVDFLKALPGALKRRWQVDLKAPPPQPSEPQFAHSVEKVPHTFPFLKI